MTMTEATFAELSYEQQLDRLIRLYRGTIRGDFMRDFDLTPYLATPLEMGRIVSEHRKRPDLLRQGVESFADWLVALDKHHNVSIVQQLPQNCGIIMDVMYVIDDHTISTFNVVYAALREYLAVLNSEYFDEATCQLRLQEVAMLINPASWFHEGHMSDSQFISTTPLYSTGALEYLEARAMQERRASH